MKARDRRDAIPSWNGYIYQGEIAIVTLLEKLLDFSEEEIQQYSIGIEDIEDFSLYCNDDLVSIHQVKSTQSRNLYDYSEALYVLAKSLVNHRDALAYLHTSQELDVSQKKIQTIIQEYEKQQIFKWNAILNDAEQMKKAYEVLKNGITKKNKLDERINAEHKSILQYSLPLGSRDDFTEEQARESIEKYVTELKHASFPPELIERIALYFYRDGRKALPSDKTLEYIECLLIDFWMQTGAIGRDEHKQDYRLLLQEEITKHVHARSNDTTIYKHLPFKMFQNIMNQSQETSGEQRLLNEKFFLIQEYKDFCKLCDLKDIKCDDCDLNQVVIWFTSINTIDFRRASYMLSPHINQDILLTKGIHLFESSGLHETMFLVLQKLQLLPEIVAFKITYHCAGKYHMLTDIFCGGNPKQLQRRLDQISQNMTIEDICREIDQNREFAAQRMEIDSLIIGYDYQDEIPDVEEHLHRVTQVPCRETREPSYMKITNKRQLSLISAKQMIERFGGKANG